jgi:hypothetical protein
LTASGQRWEQGPADLDIDEADGRWAAKNALFAVLVSRFGCGTSDGACVVMAQVIQRCEGGDIYVIEGAIYGPEQLAHHAVVRLEDGRYADAYGRGDERAMLENFTRLAGSDVESRLQLRPWRLGDLPDAESATPLDVASLAKLWRSVKSVMQRAQRSAGSEAGPRLQATR